MLCEARGMPSGDGGRRGPRRGQLFGAADRESAAANSEAARMVTLVGAVEQRRRVSPFRTSLFLIFCVLLLIVELWRDSCFWPSSSGEIVRLRVRPVCPAGSELFKCKFVLLR